MLQLAASCSLSGACAQRTSTIVSFPIIHLPLPCFSSSQFPSRPSDSTHPNFSTHAFRNLANMLRDSLRLMIASLLILSAACDTAGIEVSAFSSAAHLQAVRCADVCLTFALYPAYPVSIHPSIQRARCWSRPHERMQFHRARG
jgi:hypothetical protein